jgi:hypothetical protein
MLETIIVILESTSNRYTYVLSYAFIILSPFVFPLFFTLSISPLYFLLVDIAKCRRLRGFGCLPRCLFDKAPIILGKFDLDGM